MPGWSDFLFFLFFCFGAVNVLLFTPRFEFRFSEDGRLRWKMLITAGPVPRWNDNGQKFCEINPYCEALDFFLDVSY
jgi:hypothetical protein